MQKQQRTSFLTILTASLFIGFATTAGAQENSLARNDKEVEAITAEGFDPADDGASGSATVADAQVAQNFAKQFTGITNAKWTKTNEGYSVQFTKDGFRNQAFLTKKGKAYITTRSYTENELPADVRNDVKKAYVEFNITSVTEVNVDKQPAVYLITITGLNTWKEISVANGEIKVRNEYVKG